MGPYSAALAKGDKPVLGQETLSREDLALETLMLRLRTSEGIDLADFERRFGVNLSTVNATLIESLVGRGAAGAQCAMAKTHGLGAGSC